jgi:putative aldouronate transport system substrate-binding protein
LQSDGADLYKSVPEFAWKATAINGKIYGVPNQQIWVKPFGPSIRKDLAEKYNLDLAALNKIEDFEPFLAAVKAGEPDVLPASGGSFITEYWGWDPIVTQALAISVKYDDAEMKVFNAYDTPEVKAHIELMYKWYEAGYFPSEIIPGEEFNNQWKAGKIASNLFEVQKPGGDLEFKNNRGYDIVAKNLSPVFMTTGSVTATMNGICASSKNPNTAMKVLNLINTDAQLYNILAKGVEGKHWVWVDQANNIIGPGPEKDNYNPGTDWMFGSVFNAYYADKAYADIKFNESTKELNDSSKPSVALGFSFNPDPVKNEIAQVSAVVKELGEPLMSGMVDPATAYPEYLQALKDAGIDAIITEAQSQLNAWAGK